MIADVKCKNCKEQTKFVVGFWDGKMVYMDVCTTAKIQNVMLRN